MAAIPGSGGIGQPRGIGSALFGLGLVVPQLYQPAPPDQPPGLGAPEVIIYDDRRLPQARPPIAHIVAANGNNWQGQPTPLWLETVLKAWEPLPPQVPLVQKSPPLVQGGGNWQGQPEPLWLSTVLKAWEPLPPQVPLVQKSPPLIQAGSNWQAGGLPKWLSSALQAWVPPFVLPQPGQLLVQPTIQVIVQPPARDDRWQATVFLSWVPPFQLPQPGFPVPPPSPRADLPPSVGVPQIVSFDDPPLPQPPAHTPQGGGDSAFVRYWLDSVIGQWQVNPDTRPQPPSRTPQGGGDRVVPPRPWLDPVVGQWQVNPDTRPQPPSHTAQGGSDRQPVRWLWLDSVVSGWQVNPDTRPQPPARTAQGGGDQQPFTRMWLDGVLVNWRPTDVALQSFPKSPQVATTVVQGAFTRPWLDGVALSWQPLDIRPQPPARVTPPSSDNVPSAGVPSFTFVDEFVLPQVAPRLVQSATTVFQQAFTRPWLDSVVVSWQAPDIRPQPPARTAQGGGDQVVFDGRKWLDPVVGGWQVNLDTRPQSPARTPPSTPQAIQPPSVGVPFIVVIDDFVLPQVAPRTPQVTATTVFQQAFDARQWQYTVWQTWQPPAPLPTLSQKLTPPTVNAPPVGVQPPPWEAFMWWHWQAPPPLPTIPPHMAHLIPPPPIVTSTAKFLLIMGVGT